MEKKRPATRKAHSRRRRRCDQAEKKGTSKHSKQERSEVTRSGRALERSGIASQHSRRYNTHLDISYMEIDGKEERTRKESHCQKRQQVLNTIG